MNSPMIEAEHFQRKDAESQSSVSDVQNVSGSLRLRDFALKNCDLAGRYIAGASSSRKP